MTPLTETGSEPGKSEHWVLLDRRTNLLYREPDCLGHESVCVFGSRRIMEIYRKPHHIPIREGARHPHLRKLFSRYWGLHGEFSNAIRGVPRPWFNDFTGWSARHGKFWWRHPKYPHLFDMFTVGGNP